LGNFSDLDAQKRYQLLLLNEVLGLAIIWLNQATGKPFSQIEEILLDVAQEQVELKEYQGIRPVMDSLDDVYVEL
jgi:hypothetical protein